MVEISSTMDKMAVIFRLQVDTFADAETEIYCAIACLRFVCAFVVRQWPINPWECKRCCHASDGLYFSLGGSTVVKTATPDCVPMDSF